MTFEEALKSELNAVSGLASKIFPLVAQQETAFPFCVYKKENVKFYRTLSGTMNKVEALYNLTLITKDYAQLQTLSSLATDTLLSFLQRSIGIGGPYIENVSVVIVGDEYVREIEAFREDIQLIVKY